MKSVVPPAEAHELAAWFAEGVRAELAELEKKGGDRRYELHAGRRITPDRSPYVIYRFTLADNTLVPEDSSGTIEVQRRQFKAKVVAQESSRVDVEIDGAEAIGPFIARAILCVDDLGLLRKLAEVLEGVASGTERVSPLTTRIFHPTPNGTRKLPLPAIPALDPDRVSAEQRGVLEQACASEVTYVWGPPGTGKTYVIAHLIAALVERGERVLMTSHTHAAVNQSVYETVKPAAGSKWAGPLANSDLHREGKIVRIGRVTNEKVPETVRLDNIVDRKAQGIRSQINDLQRMAAPLSSKRAQLNVQLAEWDRLGELRRRFEEARHAYNQAAALANDRLAQRAQASRYLEECHEQVEIAQEWQPFDLFTSWLNLPAKRIARAREALAAAEGAFQIASKVANDAVNAAHEIRRSGETLRVETQTQADKCARLPAAEALRQQLIPVDAELDGIERRLTELRAHLDRLEKDVITNARVVATTLTKCYVGDDLDGQSFDALIVDEISMALPPLLFVAARRALRRVILVGDFKQLPPIVRSDNEVSEERLRQDAFHLARIAHDLEPNDHAALTRLTIQRRMVPAIANVARHISYGPKGLQDHPEVLLEAQPDWLSFLPPKALVVIDTADLHLWCGKQAGSLSRFNLYSAQIAVELATMAAAKLARPDPKLPPPIGIVTPYAAQRRLVSKLVQALDLTGWVAAGTVHTFQGGEAELIIFDSVLDEPHFTARLCNPRDANEVRRDLNVAVTRAKYKFLLVGSSEWLNRHAKPASGLGQLWHYMKDHADLVAAHELLDVGFAGRVANSGAGTHCIPVKSGRPVLERLNENTFFDRFSRDLHAAKDSIFGHVAFFGRYRWPKVEPLFRAALERGVEVTLITPPPSEADNKSYVEKAIHSLRQLGAVVVSARGLHGKDVIIDARVLYAGSLNVASHRGTSEDVHRIESAEYARTCLEFVQARHIRTAAQQGNQPRRCPRGHPVQIVNQARPMRQWDKQPMKIGCCEYKNKSAHCKYLVNIDERPPFLEPPVCSIDQRTKYRRVKRGRGEAWECPKHPKECERFKVVPGDPS